MTLRPVRSCLMKSASLVVLALCGLAIAWADTPKPRKRGPVVLTEEALALHREALVIDGHNDLPWQLREKADLSFLKLDIRKPQPSIHTDLPRLRKGGLGAQFWAAYVEAERRKDGTAVRRTLEQIDAIQRMVKLYPEAFESA